MAKKKFLVDKIMIDSGSPILNEEHENIAVSGKLSIGNKGNPVSIIIEDEVSGEMLEIEHVNVGLLIIEDTRSKSSGWLSLAIGNMEKLAEVLKFLARITFSGLKKMGGQ